MRERTISDGRTDLTVSDLCLGTMYFGYRTDEPTAHAILDRFAEAGGTFLDTANNYGQWDGDAGESERVIGRWLRSRGLADQMVVATKVGARTLKPGDPDPAHWQGLGGSAIHEDAELSLTQLGLERLPLYYAHVEDRTTPLEETVGALADLVTSGKVGLLGASNHSAWRLERSRAIARSAGLPTYCAVQQMHTYLLPQPGPRQNNLIGTDLADYATVEDLTLLGYSPLLSGWYARGTDLRPEYRHPTNDARAAVLRKVAAELGATPNQVVLAWMLRTDPPVIPIVGASSVEQLDEALGAMDVDLDDELVSRLDAAGRG